MDFGENSIALRANSFFRAIIYYGIRL